MSRSLKGLCDGLFEDEEGERIQFFRSTRAGRFFLCGGDGFVRSMVFGGAVGVNGRVKTKEGGKKDRTRQSGGQQRHVPFQLLTSPFHFLVPYFTSCFLSQ
jgi:hypothetical protein